MADDLVVREWTEDEKYYVPVPYWEMYNVVARAHLAVTAERDAEMERVKACDHIAEGDEGWEVLRNICVSTMSVAALRDQLKAITEERDNWRKAHRETFDRLTRLCADLQQEINDRASREEKLRAALELIWRDAEKYSGWWAMNKARTALSPTDTKEPGR